MKEKFTVFFMVVLIVGIAVYFSYTNGWYEFRRNTDTPKEFLNPTSTSKENYSRDSIEINNQVKTLIARHKDFFYSKEYFEGTNILIDTIVYSPRLDKLAVLVITKNPASRQLQPAKDKHYYYNGTSYLGVRKGDTISLSWLGPVFTNSMDKSELSNELREACFRTFVSKDTTKEYSYKYNLNDIRFWTSSVWRLIDETN
ncbi:hypothetical protein [Segetibacter aerophilus]|uniref:Uncharacterized protein n=1 Tax=Segetibacter aerophilus TaxID=670293 RepID=A0A512BGL7_9BACT|nr:hypothetical protein [Segetibacter aerophilus]GEO11111.1 hypothetical protein SAE01_36070 [Segetibacter aerophilus]